MSRILASVAALACLCTAIAQATSKDPLQAAEDALLNDHFDAAIQLVDRSLLNSTASSLRSRLLAVRAAALIGKDRSKEAEKDIQDALQTAPDKDTRGYIMDNASFAYRARAGHYADYQSFNQQKLELAVANYSAALNYDVEDSQIYHDRGYAYLLNMQLDEAIRDFQHAIDIDDSSAKYYEDLGTAHEMSLDLASAIWDYTDAINRYADVNNYYFDRGRAYAMIQNYAAAERDLERSRSIDPDDLPTIVWLHIVHAHTNRNDLGWLSRLASSLDLKHWPGPAISYFLQKESAADLVSFALNDARTKQKYQRCDGWFYVAEDDLQRRNVSGARDLLQKVIKNCNAIDFEWDAAKAELGRL